MSKQHQGPIGILLQYKGYNKYAREEIPKLKVPRLSCAFDAIASSCLRGILPPHVRLATVKLCAFLNAISQKAINLVELVTLCIYNLPPWLYMKRKFIMMSILIQGPRQPGNDIDVYLKPLVEELLVL